MATFGGLLKQSTAANVMLGPMVDVSDHYTLEGGITFTYSDIQVFKEGDTIFRNKNETTAATHKGGGYYSVPLDTTDTNTVGRFLVKVTDPGTGQYLPLGTDRLFQILHATTWNALYSASPAGFDVNADVTVGTIFGTALTQLQTASNDAMVALHLDHLLAQNYDPASKPGNATSLLNELIESDGGVSRFTANALLAVANAISDQVWTEAISDHSGTSGSTAATLDKVPNIQGQLGNIRGSQGVVGRGKR